MPRDRKNPRPKRAPRTARALGIIYFVEETLHDMARMVDGRANAPPKRARHELDEPTGRGVDEVLDDESLRSEEIQALLLTFGRSRSEAEELAGIVFDVIALARKERRVRVGAIDVPAYLVAGERPPHHRTNQPAFHLRTWEMPTPVAFPRKLFAEVLEEHARLLAEHGADVLDTPMIERGERRYLDPYDIGSACALLAVDGATHSVHKWSRPEVSWVVDRCVGIVRQLAEATFNDEMYVVVVAAGAASLHVVRALAPRRAGERARIEVVAPALVVEPWEQRHESAGRMMITTWRTPGGRRVVSRTPRRLVQGTIRNVVAALLRRYDARLRKGVAWWREARGDGEPAVRLQTDLDGEEFGFVSRVQLATGARAYPRLIREIRKGGPGFVPVLVDGLAWGALAWLPGGAGDVATPATNYDWSAKHGPCPGKSVPDLYVRSHRGWPDAEELEEERREDARIKLIDSLMRLLDLMDQGAPKDATARERAVAKELIAQCEPAHAQKLLREWPRAARALERDEEPMRRRPDREKPN